MPGGAFAQREWQATLHGNAGGSANGGRCHEWLHVNNFLSKISGLARNEENGPWEKRGVCKRPDFAHGGGKQGTEHARNDKKTNFGRDEVGGSKSLLRRDDRVTVFRVTSSMLVPLRRHPEHREGQVHTRDLGKELIAHDSRIDLWSIALSLRCARRSFALLRMTERGGILRDRYWSSILCRGTECAARSATRHPSGSGPMAHDRFARDCLGWPRRPDAMHVRRPARRARVSSEV